MSGRRNIDLRTETSIRAQITDLSTGRAVFGCGCEQRWSARSMAPVWWLCSYHEGFEDAIDVLEQEKDTP